jgi:hypothetical protein
MGDVIRIVATDADVLEAQVAQATAGQPESCIVTRGTCWYTAREPVHAAIVTRPDAGDAAA